MAAWKNALHKSHDIFSLKRDAIIREAGRIFSKQGFHNCSLDEVAELLDVSKGTLYNYVKDKQEILFECHKIAIGIAEKAFGAADAGDSGAKQLETILTTYATLINDELACGIISETGSLREDDRRVVKAQRRKLNQRLVTIVRKGIRDGSLRAVDPEIAVQAFVGAIHAIPSWYSPNGRLTGADIAREIVGVLMNGLLADRPVKLAQTVAPKPSTAAPPRKRQVRA